MVLVVVLGVVPGVVAADQRMGSSVVIGPDEVVTGGLEVAAGTVVIDGRVEGDLSGAAGSVVINGEVTGNVQVGTGSLTVGEDAVVGGNLDAGAGSIVVAGTVRGDATLGADTVRLADTARFDGNVEYDAGTFVREDGAVVSGALVRNDDLVVVGSGDAGFGAFDFSPVWFAWNLVVTLAVGAVLLALLPARSAQVVRTALSRPVDAGIAGVLGLVAAIVGIVLLVVTIVGIPVALLGAIVFALVAWAGSIYGRIAVGDWVLDRLDVDGGRWGGLLLGVVGVALVGLIPVLGGIVELVVFVLGFGALALLTYEHYRGGREAATPDAGDTERPAV